MASTSQALVVARRAPRTLLLGAGAGVVATLAMSGLMYVAQRVGLLGRSPPRHIVEHALARFGIRRKVSTPARALLSAFAHLAFGASQGALYAIGQDLVSSTRRTPSSPSAVSGIPFALAVWAASYAGWIPALGILPKPSHDRPGRPSSMVLAHIVYGAALSNVLKRSRQSRLLAGAPVRT